MKRLLTAIPAVLLVAAAGRAQDTIHLNREKDPTVRGTIQAETPALITIKATAGGIKRIPVAEVRDVEYNVRALVRPDYRAAINREAEADAATREDLRREKLKAALDKYSAVLANLAAGEENAKRHIEFKVARLTALQAEADPELADKAVERLTKFRKDYPKAWETTAATDLLARLLVQKKDWDGAQKAYEELAETPGIAPATRLQCEVKVADVLVRNKKYAAAEKKLQDLARTVPGDSPQAVLVQVSLAECEAASDRPDQGARRVEAVLAKVTDPELKALAYNTLGDCHRQAKHPKEALWNYLWVDVVYHQDRQEHAKALYHLAQLFKELKDDARAKQYHDKLLKDKQFAGMEYQQKLVAEEK